MMDVRLIRRGRKGLGLLGDEYGADTRYRRCRSRSRQHWHASRSSRVVTPLRPGSVYVATLGYNLNDKKLSRYYTIIVV